MKVSTLWIAMFVSALAGCATVSPQRGLPGSAASPNEIPLGTALPQSEVSGPIPAGYIGFCLRYYEQCQLPRDAQGLLDLTPASWSLLRMVNATTNEKIVYEDDETHYGISDYWTIAQDGYGDCEDFALTKRKLLIDAGLPPAALRIAIVLTGRKERHAVLTVATDRGDFVLDSASDEVHRWTDTDYIWLERQDPKELWSWDVLNADGSGSQAIAASSLDDAQ